MNTGPLSIINKGAHVKVFLRNGMVLEGIVEEDAAQFILKALDGESLMILHRPTEDIMMTKVMLVERAAEENVPPKAPPEFHERVTAKLNEIQEAEGNLEFKEKSIAELKEMAREQELKILAQKKREHFGTAGAAKMTEYTSPYTPMRTVGRKLVPRTAYQPGKIPSWAYGRPPRKGE